MRPAAYGLFDALDEEEPPPPLVPAPESLDDAPSSPCVDTAGDTVLRQGDGDRDSHGLSGASLDGAGEEAVASRHSPALPGDASSGSSSSRSATKMARIHSQPGIRNNAM